MTRSLAGPIVAGNWKLNLGPTEARDFFRRFLPLVNLDGDGTLLFFPTALSFAAAADSLEDGSGILLGVQNIYWEEAGAYTGELSASMAAGAGAAAVLIGHSERRHVFGETDAETQKKTSAALSAGLSALLCVGEKIEERESGREFEVVDRQLNSVISRLSAGMMDRFAIAYEPVWAIGTGKTATVADATQMHQHIRATLVDRFGEEARGVPILYGGSVKPGNALDLMAAPEIGGVLVGGASLDPEAFASIWKARP